LRKLLTNEIKLALDMSLYYYVNQYDFLFLFCKILSFLFSILDLDFESLSVTSFKMNNINCMYILTLALIMI